MNCSILPPVYPMHSITIYILFGLNVITSIFSIIINLCFMAGIFSNNSLMTPTNLLVASLSLSDFLVGFITQPIYSAHLLVNQKETKNCMLAYGSFFTLGTFCGASGLCLPIISLDRCIRMAKLTYYRTYVTKKRVLVVLCILWVNAVAIAFTPLYGIPQTVFYALLIGYLGINAIIMFASYIYVVRKSRRSITIVQPESVEQRRSRNQDLSRQVHVTITVTNLIAVAIFSWLPLFIAALIWTLGLPASNESEAIVTFHYVLLQLGFAASSINPILYCWRLREVRKATVDVLRKVLKCI